MDYTIEALPSRLTLGEQTETGVNDIRIDMSEWLKQWPNLAISIWPTRPGEKAAYPADTYMDGSAIIWRVNNADTAIAGSGAVQIMGVAEGQKKLSKVINTYIASTTTGVTTDPPEAAQPWADGVAASAASAQQAAQRAEDAASEIKGISAVAQTLKAGQAATAEYADGVLRFGIPEGKRGIAGEQGPQGPKGDKGDTGPQGPKGDPGETYTLPVASATTLGGVKPADKTAEMTQSVGVDADGALWAEKDKDINQLKQDLSAEQAAREQADTSLQQEVHGKLPKSPANWGPWTAEEQAVACERIGVEYLGEWEEIVTVTTEEAVSSLTVNTDKNGNPFSLTHVICEFILPIEDTSKTRSVYFGSDSAIGPFNSFSKIPAPSSTVAKTEFGTYAKIISGKIYCDGGIAPALPNKYQASQKYGIVNGYCMLSAESFNRIFVITYSDAFPAGSQLIIRGIRK